MPQDLVRLAQIDDRTDAHRDEPLPIGVAQAAEVVRAEQDAGPDRPPVTGPVAAEVAEVENAGEVDELQGHEEHYFPCPRARGETGFLSGIAVSRDHQGQGLGAAVTAVVTRSLLHEYAVVALGVMWDNAIALRLYERLGYRSRIERTSVRLM